MRPVFVSGTDTGVGKTVVAGALARTAAAAGCRTAVYKPFMAGGTGDIAALAAAAAAAPATGPSAASGKDGGNAAGPVAARYEYAFRTPASPYTAARLEGAAIDIGAVLDRLAQLRRDYEAVVVEGIGGAMTPLHRDYFVADLARDMVAPVVIVTSNGFDAAGHSAMAESSCRRRGARVAGFVINSISEYGYVPAALRGEIGAVAEAPVLATIKRQKTGAPKGGGYDIAGALRALGVDVPAGADGAESSAHAAIRAFEGGYVDGAARIMFGGGRGGGAAARWREQRRKRRMRRKKARESRRPAAG